MATLAPRCFDDDERALQKQLVIEVQAEHGSWHRRVEASVLVNQAPLDAGIGGAVYDAALVLCRVLAKEALRRRGTSWRVLDVGCGCGTVGHLASALGSTAVLTDHSQRAIDVAARGRTLTSSEMARRPELRQWAWGGDVSRLPHAPFDVVTASDCLFAADDVAAKMLARTVDDALAQTTGACALVAWRRREKVTRGAELTFFQELASRELAVEHVDVERDTQSSVLVRDYETGDVWLPRWSDVVRVVRVKRLTTQSR